jgi:predicted DsbA family dithiol-disulfide isomerase
MRALLWERQNLLPKVPLPQQSPAQLELFESWAAELNLDGAAFQQALESPVIADRVRSDIELANKLGISAVPVVFLDGKRILGWSKLETWEALLGELPVPTSQPESAPSR